MKKYILLLISLVFLSACSSKMAEIQFYHLPLPNAENQQALSGGKHILVLPVQVPEYLAGSGIVYQLDDVEYKTAKNSRWAEALSTQLQSSLAAELRSKLPGQMVLTRGSAAPGTSILVQISGFHGRYDGMAVVSGGWLIMRGDRVVLQKAFEHTIRQESDGYKALVEALYQGWRAEAAQVAEAIKMPL